MLVVFISKIQNENKCDYFPVNGIILTMKSSININSLSDEIENEKIINKNENDQQGSFLTTTSSQQRFGNSGKYIWILKVS